MKWPSPGTMHYGIMKRLLDGPAQFGSPEMKRMAWELVEAELVSHDGCQFSITDKGQAHMEKQ